MNPIEWAKTHKLVSLLILVVLYLAFSRNSGYTPLMQRNGEIGTLSYGTSPMVGTTKVAPSRLATDVYQESVDYAASNRRVVTESFLSLQVADVPASVADIKSKAESLKGFMVNASVSRPEEAASGSITIRVPITESDEMIAYLKENSIKVVNEDVQGRDITDQYQDIETRLATLQKNKARFEVIMDEAKTINEILQVQGQIFQLQDQIDSLIGQRDYLKNTSETVKITAYLATDEFALPYVPDTSWRPAVVFKEAVRSLIMDLRSLGTKAIWIAVYTVIWVPVLLLLIVTRRYWKMRSARMASVRKN